MTADSSHSKSKFVPNKLTFSSSTASTSTVCPPSKSPVVPPPTPTKPTSARPALVASRRKRSLGPPPDSDAYKQLKPLMASLVPDQPTPTTSQSRELPVRNSVKSRLGARKSAKDRLHPKVAPPPPPPVPVSTPASSSSPPSSDWTGPLAPSGNCESKRSH